MYHSLETVLKQVLFLIQCQPKVALAKKFYIFYNPMQVLSLKSLTDLLFSAILANKLTKLILLHNVKLGQLRVQLSKIKDVQKNKFKIYPSGRIKTHSGIMSLNCNYDFLALLKKIKFLKYHHAIYHLFLDQTSYF